MKAKFDLVQKPLRLGAERGLSAATFLHWFSPMSMSQDAAETFALKALAWLVGNDELFAVFMGSTGVGQDEVRARAGDPVFLASVLDFLLMNDAWIMEFCDTYQTAYDVPMQARAALPGGQQVHWT